MNDEELTPDEMAKLRRVMGDQRGLQQDLEVPPPNIWAAIEAELEAQSIDGSLERNVDEPNVDVSNVVQLKVPSGIARYLLAAAVLAIAAIGVATFLDRPPEEIILASGAISNDGMPLELPASGTANLVSVDGMLRLDVDVEQLQTDTGYFELWVARPDASEVKSLGAIADDGSFDWPEGVDPDEFTAVAISLEEDDGDPSFSGIAVLFGVLQA